MMYNCTYTYIDVEINFCLIPIGVWIFVNSFFFLELNLTSCRMSTSYHNNITDTALSRIIDINHFIVLLVKHFQLVGKNFKVAFEYNNTFCFDKNKIKKLF